MHKVFVTGADGLLGSMICRHLLKADYQVTALCLTGTTSASLEDLPVQIVYGNVCDKEGIAELIKGHDYVIHAAANTTVWPRRNKQIWDVNYEGTMNIKEGCLMHGIKRMIFVGSASAFKEGSISHPGNEDTYSGKRSVGMDYIESKQQATLDLLQTYKEDGFPVIVIAPTFMIGPYDIGPSSGKLLINIYNKKLPGYTEGGKNFVYSGDVASMAVKSLTEGKLGECYIIGGENLSYRDFFKLSHDVFSRKFNMVKVPSFVILSIGMMSSAAGRLLPVKPKISYGIAKLSLVKQFYSTAKAEKDLEYKPSAIKDAIIESMEWFKSNGYVK